MGAQPFSFLRVKKRGAGESDGSCVGVALELCGPAWSCLGVAWELSGSCLGAVWDLSGGCLGAAWELSWSCLKLCGAGGGAPSGASYKGCSGSKERGQQEDFGAPSCLEPVMRRVRGPKIAEKVDRGPLWGRSEGCLGSKVSSTSRLWNPFWSQF